MVGRDRIFALGVAKGASDEAQRGHNPLGRAAAQV